MTTEEARSVLAAADQLCSAEDVLAAVRRIAQEITEGLADRYPLVVAVMHGATVFAGQLLPLLPFPLDFHSMRATRYGQATIGGEVRWPDESTIPVKGRTVLILDDILDEGKTLFAIQQRMLALGAASCHLAVLVDKNIGRTRPVIADYVGLTVPNRFVFGFGMDYEGMWRNLPAIYALKEVPPRNALS